MSKFLEQHKQRPSGVNDTAGRMARALFYEKCRRVQRESLFSSSRETSPKPKQGSETKQANLRTRLQKWKVERALQKKLEQQKKNPVFKAGVVHHLFWAPTMKDESNTLCHTRGDRDGKTQLSPPKRITRATEKRLEAKKLAAASVTSSAAAVSGLAMPKKQTPVKTPLRTSIAPASYPFKSPAGVESIPMFGRFVLTKDSVNEQLQDLKASMNGYF